jgi:hypothetical protein
LALRKKTDGVAPGRPQGGQSPSEKAVNARFRWVSFFTALVGIFVVLDDQDHGE